MRVVGLFQWNTALLLKFVLQHCQTSRWYTTDWKLAKFSGIWAGDLTSTYSSNSAQLQCVVHVMRYEVYTCKVCSKVAITPRGMWVLSDIWWLSCSVSLFCSALISERFLSVLWVRALCELLKVAKVAKVAKKCFSLNFPIRLMINENILGPNFFWP